MVASSRTSTCTPLAALGIAPIFYMFASALYTKLELQRIRRKNGIEPRIRAKSMTGEVEVDLPVYQLDALPQTDHLYWKGAMSKTIDGASWSRYIWFN